MRFWNYKSNSIYEIYLILFDSTFPIEKKKIILKSLFAGEHYSWKIVGISKSCFDQYKKNNFKKIVKFTRVNKKLIRHPFINFSIGADCLFKKKLSNKDLWKKIDQNEKTHLITKSERDSKNYLYIEVPEEGGYFLNKTVGYEFAKKEELFLKYINQQKVEWKKCTLESPFNKEDRGDED